MRSVGSISTTTQDSRLLGQALSNRRRTDWKTACHKWVGHLWLAQLLVALGDVTEEVLELLNEEVERRAEEAEPSLDAGALRAPRLLTGTALAAAKPYAEPPHTHESESRRRRRQEQRHHINPHHAHSTPPQSPTSPKPKS